MTADPSAQSGFGEIQPLASYAQTAAESAGRALPEAPHPHRTPYQRDRSRIIHSRAFRRLEYKTQVFLNGTGDHLRTRLTHTIEVASVARSIAFALGLNQDLTEAIALAHDLGHAPFGHAGEAQLNSLMAEHGGFEHNSQSLRIVERIEKYYPGFDGLNLSYEVLEGLRKHQSGHSRSLAGRDAESFPSPSLEAQVANIADELTYYSHDLDDGLTHGLIDPRSLADLILWQFGVTSVGKVVDSPVGSPIFHRYVVRRLIDLLVEDLIQATSEHISRAGISSADDVRTLPHPLAQQSATFKSASLQLRSFLYENLYHHPVVAEANRRGQEVIVDVFNHYLEAPSRLGELTAHRAESDGTHRAICDYVSGMTDRFILDEVARIRG